MIASEHNVKTVHGNLTGERVGMTIDQEFMGTVMDYLANYADQITAVIREYSTNGRDAMIEAGRGAHPIEVTLPGSLSPFFSVKDTGIGMDADDIRNIYSHYGASTKRMTNDQVGTFGIGCKSALAYADQFTLVGVKNGVRTQVAISRKADGGGDMTIIDESPTTEPNGVEIVIPVKSGDADKFRAKAEYFFSHWERGTVLVDGVEPKSFEDDAIHIPGTEMWVVANSERSECTVVMGNVPYPCRIASALSYQHRIIARVPIGAVDILHTRESLKQNSRTQNALDGLAVEFKANAGKAVQVKIDQATTKREAIIARAQWAGALGGKAGDVYKWRGQTLPRQLEVKGAVSCGSHGLHRTGDNIYEPTCSKCTHADPSFHVCDTRPRDWSGFVAHRSLGLVAMDPELADNHSGYGRLQKYAIVTGYDRGEKPTATVKKKLLQYLEDNNITDINWVMFFRSALTPEQEDTLSWINPIKRIAWRDVWATKLPRAHTQTTNGKPKGSYPVAYPPDANWTPPVWANSNDRSIGVTTKDVPADELPDDILYTNSSIGNAYQRCLQVDKPVVYLAANRFDKFKRTFPKAKEAGLLVSQILKDYVKTLSEDELLVMSRGNSYYYTDINVYRGWDLLDGKVNDPDVSRMIGLGKLDVSAKRNRLRELGGGAHNLNPTTTFNDPRAAYPLLDDTISKDEVEHAAIYINAVYAAKQKGAH